MSLAAEPCFTAAIHIGLRPTVGQANAWHSSPNLSGRSYPNIACEKIPGVGEAIAQVITKLHETGSHPSLEKMRGEIPESVLAMLTVPGLRADKVLKLHKELGISTLEELEDACKRDRLKGVKGLGPALQRKILAGLEERKSSRGGRHIHRAAELLEAAKASLTRSSLGLRKIEDLRRGCEMFRI